MPLFKNVREIERQIDELLDKVSEGALLLEKRIRHFLEHGAGGQAPGEAGAGAQAEGAGEAEGLAAQAELKRRGSHLRREIETGLHTQMLIPDLRGDVLRLIEDLHDLLDGCHKVGLRGTIEQPKVPEAYHADLLELVDDAVHCIEAAVMGSRAFFRDLRAVRDHVHKTGFYESQCDAIAFRLKQRIFGSNLGLEHKLQLRDYVDAIDRLADEAEELGDSLSIYAIKRSE